MQTFDPAPGQRVARLPRATRLLAAGDALTWSSGLVLAVSSFTGWYAGSSTEGPTLAVIGWHTGTIGKLVFVLGAAVVALVALRELGVEAPRALPEPLLVLLLGAAATVLVLVRVISIPDAFLPVAGRGIGIWISLAAAIGVVVAGLVRAAEEL